MSMSIQPAGLGKTNPVIPVDSSNSSNGDDATKQLLQKVKGQIEQIFQQIAKLIGQAQGGDAAGKGSNAQGPDAAQGGAGQGDSGGGSGGGCSGAGGGGSPGGGGSAPGAGGSPGGASGPTPNTGNAKSSSSGPAHAEVDVNGDGKNDIAYNGPNAQKFADQTAKDVKTHPKYAQEILDNAKANSSGMTQVAVKDPSQMSMAGAAGVAPVGQKGIGTMEYGTHEMASDTTPENQMAVEAHEMQHNSGYDHGAEMDAAVKAITA